MNEIKFRLCGSNSQGMMVAVAAKSERQETLGGRQQQTGGTAVTPHETETCERPSALIKSTNPLSYGSSPMSTREDRL